MAKLSGGEALAKSLVREGIDVVFGLPGVQMYGLITGIRDEPGLRMITARHEFSTTHMADGYARATGKPSVAVVVPGVGLYNAGSGIATGVRSFIARFATRRRGATRPNRQRTRRIA